MAPATKIAKRKTARKKATPRTKAAPKAAPAVIIDADLTIPESVYDAQWHAKLEAYSTLKSAGVPIPDEIALPVEAWIAEEDKLQKAEAQTQAAERAKRKKADDKGPKWIRNLLGTEFALRLERQSDKTKRRIELKPRGQRGDIFPLEPGDENDHALVLSLGYVEVIGQTEAQEIVASQTHNIQKTNVPLSLIRNENDEPITKLTVETEFNKQGVTVGYIDPAAKPKDAFGGIRRKPEQVQQFVPTGGNPAIVSSGFQQQQPLSDNAKHAIADDLARRKGVQGRPEQVLGLNVQIDPTQKT